jgi:hypothetical protein
MRGELIKQEFESNYAPELGVVGFTHHTEPVLARLFGTFVV